MEAHLMSILDDYGTSPVSLPVYTFLYEWEVLLYVCIVMHMSVNIYIKKKVYYVCQLSN